MRLDLHIHSHYSRDCLMDLDSIMETVIRRGLDGVALTDHNRIEGALRLAESAPFRVIVGEEIKTTAGEIIGLFLSEEIPPGLTPQATVAAIHAQGGLVYVPHPMDRIRRSCLGPVALESIAGDVDAVEGANARVLLPADNRRAQAWAMTRGIPMGAGSDAHSPSEIGTAFVNMADFEGPEGFLESLYKGSLGGGISAPWVHLSSTWAKRYKKWLRKGRDR